MQNESLAKIAVLMTCYNRVEKTLKCLDHLYNATVPENALVDIYLVDDNSPDQTGKIVKDKYPNVNVILGTGSLYWNRGMRLAWKKARQQRDYDFYLWLNDDTYIYTNALQSIFTDYYHLRNDGIEAIISGVCCDSISNEISYGGRDRKYKFIVPNGLPQPCRYINGNFTLVSKKIFYKLTYFSNRYVHAAGDHDYGLRAKKKGFNCYVSSSVLAICSHGEDAVRNWLDPNVPLRKRIRNLFSIKGENCRDTMFFILKDSGFLKAFKYIIICTWKVLFP